MSPDNRVYRDRTLEQDSCNQVMKHLRRLWGFPVHLEEVGFTNDDGSSNLNLSAVRRRTTAPNPTGA